MTFNMQNIEAETIAEFFGLTIERGAQLHDEVRVMTESAIHADLGNKDGVLNKNKYINNAVQLAKTEVEAQFILYHMGGFMESLQQWLENNKNITILK